MTMVTLTVLSVGEHPRSKLFSLLLPEVKSFEDYRQSGRDWLDQMLVLDSEMSGVLSGDNSGDLFKESRQAQQMTQGAVNLTKEIDQVKYRLQLPAFTTSSIQPQWLASKLPG